MSKFRPKLARINNMCCEQVMPVAVVPICAISNEIPRPIFQLPTEPIDSFTNQITQQVNLKEPNTIANYYPGINVKIGTILTNTMDTVPNGYVLCDGSELSRIDYSTLFQEIGTLYGEGNTQTTFNLPNLIESNTDSKYRYIIKIYN